MVKYALLVMICFAFPIQHHAQFVGLAGQYSHRATGQFVASVSIPTIHPKNKLNMFVSSGAEYTTSGGATMAGLYLKPLQLSWFGTEDFFNSTPFTMLLQTDVGYLFDFRRGRKDGFIISPSLYVDYKFYFVKTGYDMDLTHGRRQFFARVGLCVGLGTLKSFLDTQIW